MLDRVKSSLVRVRCEADQRIVGTGFLIDIETKAVVTCAHVVNAAFSQPTNDKKPRELISIDFPFLQKGDFKDGRVIEFRRKEVDGAGDIAILQLLDDLPENAQVAKLATSDTYGGHEFGTYGFPYPYENEGRYVEGKLQEKITNEQIQAIGNTNLGYFVEQGFSGSPVIDKFLNAVIGMVTRIDTPAETRIAFITPSDVIAQLVPNLKYDTITSAIEIKSQSRIPREPTEKWLRRVDIFISSPSDVTEEREAILRVIERLNRLSYIRSRYVLNPLLYEKEVPPEAGDHAQMIVDRYMAVEDSYLLVCLMWNRMGTPFTHPKTGEEFQSGTEYEFTAAYGAYQDKGEPHLLLYRKIGEDADADREQEGKARTFFRRFEGDKAEFKGLYKEFASVEDFEAMLFKHIENILDKHPPQSDEQDQIDPDTRPDIVEESRRLDAAMPRECQVGKPTEVRVMICLPGSEGLRGLLPDFTAEGDLIDKRDVHYGNLAVAFPVNKQTGLPEPILLSVEIKASEFDIEESIQKVALSPLTDSGTLIFFVTPRNVSKRSRILISVKSGTHTEQSIILGSASLYTTVSMTFKQLAKHVAWSVVNIPLGAISVKNYDQYDFEQALKILSDSVQPSSLAELVDTETTDNLQAQAKLLATLSNIVKDNIDSIEIEKALAEEVLERASEQIERLRKFDELSRRLDQRIISETDVLSLRHEWDMYENELTDLNIDTYNLPIPQKLRHRIDREIYYVEVIQDLTYHLNEERFEEALYMYQKLRSEQPSQQALYGFKWYDPITSEIIEFPHVEIIIERKMEQLREVLNWVAPFAPLPDPEDDYPKSKSNILVINWTLISRDAEYHLAQGEFANATRIVRSALISSSETLSLPEALKRAHNPPIDVQESNSIRVHKLLMWTREEVIPKYEIELASSEKMLHRIRETESKWNSIAQDLQDILENLSILAQKSKGISRFFSFHRIETIKTLDLIAQKHLSELHELCPHHPELQNYRNRLSSLNI